MNSPRYSRKAKIKRRPHLAIAVLPDAEAAFAAYCLLQHHGVSPEHLAIVGHGYNAPEWVGLHKPWEIAFRRGRTLAIVAGSLGAIASLLIIITLRWIVTPPASVNGWLLLIPAIVLCGFCGAVVGSLVGFLGEGSTASIYRHHLHQGRYLLMIEGPEMVVRLGKEVLGQYSTPKA